ncbi:unnamed protein product [Peniophora sp. CBMAI 1063]|nr:unnamed protein product [Peniophora sp. CBMAI 1063]
MSATTEARLRVAICGGGIGGLALACALSKVTDITVDVYEAASEFQEIGAGVMLRPRNLRFLTELGLMNEIAAINGRSSEKRESAEPAMAYYRA